MSGTDDLDEIGRLAKAAAEANAAHVAAVKHGTTGPMVRAMLAAEKAEGSLAAALTPARVLALVARLRRAEEVAGVARRVIRDRASGQSHKHYDALSTALAALSPEPTSDD